MLGLRYVDEAGFRFEFGLSRVRVRFQVQDDNLWLSTHVHMMRGFHSAQGKKLGTQHDTTTKTMYKITSRQGKTIKREGKRRKGKERKG